MQEIFIPFFDFEKKIEFLILKNKINLMLESFQEMEKILTQLTKEETNG